MKKLIFLLMIVMFSAFVSANYIPIIPYDSYTDNSYNLSLWENASEIGAPSGSCTSTSNTLEQNQKLELSTDTSVGAASGCAILTKTRTKSVERNFTGFLNWTIDTQTCSTSVGSPAEITTECWNGVLIGNTIITNQYQEGGDRTDDQLKSQAVYNDSTTGNWLLKRTGLNEFSLYDDGVFLRTFSDLYDQRIEFQSSAALRHSGGGTGANANSDYYIDDVEVTGESIFVFLESPGDDSISLDPSIIFNSSAYSTNISLVNATFTLWNSTSAIINETTNALTGIGANQTIFNLSTDVLNPEEYHWNVYVCGNNNTGVVCTWQDTNHSFSYGYDILGETFTATTTEGEIEFFELNISLSDTSSLSSAILNYNNTNYSASINQITSTSYSLSRSLTIETVDAEVNQTFYWIFNIDDTQFITSSNNQTVKIISIDNCDANTRLLYNLTLKDEGDQTTITSPDNNWTIKADVDIFTIGDRGTPIAEYSGNYTNINPAQVCLNEGILDDSSFEINAVFEYSATDRETEFYHIRNFSLTNTSIPQNIDLLDLKTADSQEFLITFKDDSFSPVEDAILKITRKYVEEGVFKTVEQPITNVDGQAVAHLVTTDAIYTIQVSKDGATLATFDNVVAFCSDVTIGECTINLDAFSTEIDPTDFVNLNDLSFTMAFDRTARTVTVVYNIPSGGVSDIVLNSTLFDSRGNTTVCNDELTSSSGTLTCNIPASFGNATVLSTLTKDGELVGSAVYSIQADAQELFGGTGVIFLLLLYITLPLMLITTGPGIVIGAMAGLIFATLLNIFTTGNIIGVGSTIFWFIIAGGIIIWKVSRRE